MKKALCTMVAAGTVALSLGAIFGLAPALSGGLPAAPAAGDYAVDPVHSALVFKIGHNAGTYFGRFNKLSGSFLLDPADLSGSTLEFTVDVNSVDTASGKRDDHLRSSDFFNVKQFPTSTFKSTSIKRGGEGVYEVIGDLTVCGVTKPVTAKVIAGKTMPNPQSGKENAGFEATVTVKRTDFGISKFQGMLGEDVTLLVGIEGNR